MSFQDSDTRLATTGPGRGAALPWLSWLALPMIALMASMGTSCAPADGAAIASESSAESAADVDDENDKVTDEVMAVAAFPLTRGEIESVLRYSTNLEAESEVKIYSEAARQVVELLVEEGSRVGSRPALASAPRRRPAQCAGQGAQPAGQGRA